MAKDIIKSAATKTHLFKGDHRFEHWYIDNQIYFITARCRDRFPAFSSPQACAIFWDRFDYWTKHYHFTPWVTSLVVSHYHVLGYCRVGANLGQMVRHIHGSTAKLVNDLLPKRRDAFWIDPGHRDYFDGCIRDELQCRRAFRYTLTQCRRHHICEDPSQYANTHLNVDLERGVKRALELKAFLEGVPYKRYLDKRRGRGRGTGSVN